MSGLRDVMFMGLTDVEKWLHQCARCSSCKYLYKDYNPSCPSGEKFWFETYWASGRVWIAKAIKKGELEWSNSIVKAIFACPLCGNCTVQCQQEVSNHLLEIMESLRKEAVKAGISQTELRTLLAGQIPEDAPDEELPALAYAQHWAESNTTPEAQAVEKLHEVYGEKRAAAIHLVLRMIRVGNLLGNTGDYLLFRLGLLKLVKLPGEEPA